MSKLIRKSNKGFTLIELMIVVAIIGILAAIAIPNFLRFQLKSKSSEGKVNIAAIRTAEESYLAEFGVYIAATASPAVAATTQKVPFVDAGVAGTNFDTLGWAPEGQVFFQYVSAIGAGATVSAYSISAQADIDGEGTPQTWGYVKPVTGTAAGVVGSFGICPAAGAPNPVAGGPALLSTVAPCVLTSGQSVF
ncbi:MAG: prepilin-type N-terminal cleavage/methylation domain-containing protein [Proteobacteria bacterium]|nr:prepilin-type N-terminal cleavage/methylation domain-containing protein [Pseudomonadota bacterium]